MNVRLCRDCGEEYRLDAQVDTCTDCGAPIETREVGVPADAAPPSGAGARGPFAGPQRRLHIADRAPDLEPLARRLGRAAVPYSVRPGARGFELWVPAAEVARAREVLGDRLPAEAPAADDFDPEQGYRQCPACDAELPEKAGECPACGLAVGEFELAPCPRCGAEADPEADGCAACGHCP